MNNDTKAVTSDLAEIMPCLNESKNWQEAVPARLRDPAQHISKATGESFETVLATILTFFGAQLRRCLRMSDPRGKSVSPELNLLLVRPEKALDIVWYELLCHTLANRDKDEHLFLSVAIPGETTKLNGREYVARESQVLSDLSPYEIKRKFSPVEIPVVLLHSTATALKDELECLTRLEKKDLCRILKLSWNNDRIGTGKKAFHAGVSLLWDVDGGELNEALSVFFECSKPAPLLFVESTANPQKPSAESLEALLALQEHVWQCAQGDTIQVVLKTDVAELILSFVNAFKTELGDLPSVAARRSLGFIPRLCYHLLALLAFFTDKETEDLATAVKGMTAALARRHFSALHRFTAGFTAEPLRDPENPAEVLAEYQLLAKIDKHAPMTRKKLNAMHSNDNRKRLNVRLARLITDGRVAVDDRGRFYARSVMSV